MIYANEMERTQLYLFHYLFGRKHIYIILYSSLFCHLFSQLVYTIQTHGMYVSCYCKINIVLIEAKMKNDYIDWIIGLKCV